MFAETYNYNNFKSLSPGAAMPFPGTHFLAVNPVVLLTEHDQSVNQVFLLVLIHSILIPINTSKKSGGCCYFSLRHLAGSVGIITPDP